MYNSLYECITSVDIFNIYLDREGRNNIEYDERSTSGFEESIKSDNSANVSPDFGQAFLYNKKKTIDLYYK